MVHLNWTENAPAVESFDVLWREVSEANWTSVALAVTGTKLSFQNAREICGMSPGSSAFIAVVPHNPDAPSSIHTPLGCFGKRQQAIPAPSAQAIVKFDRVWEITSEPDWSEPDRTDTYGFKTGVVDWSALKGEDGSLVLRDGATSGTAVFRFGAFEYEKEEWLHHEWNGSGDVQFRWTTTTTHALGFGPIPPCAAFDDCARDGTTEIWQEITLTRPNGGSPSPRLDHTRVWYTFSAS